MAVTHIFASSYYARKDYRTPAFGFLYSAMLNVAVNALLVFGFNLGPASIALTTSGTALFNVLYLKKNGGVGSAAPPFVFTAVVVVCGLMTASLGNAIGDATLRLFFTTPEYSRQTFTQLIQFGVQAGSFFGSLGLLIKVIFRKEWRSLVRVLFDK
jgi:peptidoglycan biosynthesis protein MviN/MurJ (putative lipid II flippase)